MGERADTGIPSIYYAWEQAFDLKPPLIDKHNLDRTEMFVPRLTDTLFINWMVKEEPQSAVNSYQSVVNNSQSAVNDSQSAVKRDSKETRIY